MLKAEKNWFLMDGNRYPASDFDRLYRENHPTVYEVIRFTKGLPVFPWEHYERLVGSLRTVGTEKPIPYETYISELIGLAESNGITEYNCKYLINGFDLPGNLHRYALLISTYYPSDQQYRDGVTAGILRAERTDPHAKIWNTDLRRKADEVIHSSHAYEAVLADQEDRFTEGSRSSLFFIKGNSVLTAPEEAVLRGVTRKKVIELIEKAGIELEESYVTVQDAATCDAAFICGTSPKVLPLNRIGEHRFDPSNRILRQIMRLYDEVFEAANRCSS